MIDSAHISPDRGLTLLPPWLQAILRAGKRLENRSANVAHRIGGWRGLIALTQSKAWDREEEADTILSLLDDELIPRGGSEFMTLSKDWAGKIVGVAELIDVRSPEACAGHPWHAEGQWGLMLGRVWEVEPVPCIGSRGMWWLVRCPQCDTVQGLDGFSAPCRKCKHRGCDWGRVDLRVVRECAAWRRRLGVGQDRQRDCRSGGIEGTDLDRVGGMSRAQERMIWLHDHDYWPMSRQQRAFCMSTAVACECPSHNRHGIERGDGVLAQMNEDGPPEPVFRTGSICHRCSLCLPVCECG